MKYQAKRLVLSFCAISLLSSSYTALADTASDTETLLNWAEKTFPHFFPSKQATHSTEPWLYRFYPETGIYAGVNKDDINVYTLGGPWGSNPTLIDSLSSLIAQINNSGGNGNIASCDTTNTIPGITYSQSGNVITVTSNGQCVTAPDQNATNLCPIPKQTTPTGVSILSTNTVTRSNISGITASIPGLLDPFLSLISTSSNAKHCTRNAPNENTNIIVNSDLCFDITAQLSDLIGAIDGITVSPPITLSTAGTYTSQVVPDCFSTDATTITDAVTGEFWVKENGSFVKK
ncbi:MAG: hypothetical protein IPI97_07645 [Nitrosomonas sp.]|nr:hypothetical protein [Nitrosomonas sp.]MBK7364863.1 hypothetical protein [Nitrosomonas sp.]